MPDREKTTLGIREMLMRDTWRDIDANRPRYQHILNDALALLKTQEETIGELYDLLEDTCKDFREATGGDDVCGLCHYEGCAYKGEEDWCGWCPGFDSDECFVMKNEIRKMAGKELLPDIDPQ